MFQIEGDPSKGGHSAIHKVLAAACGIRGEVVKKRTLYLVGQTRVHIDEVENLGDFLELEVSELELNIIQETRHMNGVYLPTCKPIGSLSLPI